MLYLYSQGLFRFSFFFVDGCRRVKFVPPETGQYLEGHVFINLTIGIYTPCEHRCAMERKCVSVNIGPTIKEKVICELSDSDRLQHPDDIKPRPGWTYRGTQVRSLNVMTMTTRKHFNVSGDILVTFSTARWS